MIEPLLTSSRLPFSCFPLFSLNTDQIHEKTSKKTLQKLLDEKNLFFTQLEQEGICHFDASINDFSYQEQAQKYAQRFSIYLEEAQSLIETVYPWLSTAEKVYQAYFELKCRVVGLRYNLGQVNGGLDALMTPHPVILERILEKAQYWKTQQKFAPSTNWTAIQMQKIEEMAKYPVWFEIIENNSLYLKEVFKWCLKNDNPVEVIVKCYEMHRLIENALLSSSIGYASRADHELLVFVNQIDEVSKIARRVLTLPLYHGSFEFFEPKKQQRINILNPHQRIYFEQGNYQLTVKEFFAQMGQKNFFEPNITLCAHWGFVNFHPVKGVWNALEKQYHLPVLQPVTWMKEIPAARIIEHEKIEQKYPNKLKDDQFFLKVMSSRQHEGLIALDCHAYWQLYQRMNEKEWKVLNVGIYAYRFVQNPLDGLWLFCATVKRAIAFHDQNGTYTHRQRAAYPLFPHPEQSQIFLKKLHKLFSNEGVFQLMGQNCAYGVQKTISKSGIEMTKLFEMPVLQLSIGTSSFDRFLQWVHTRELKTKRFMMNGLHAAFLSHRSLVIKNKKHSVKDFLDKYQMINNPAYFVDQIAKGHLQGELYWCHSEDK